MLIMSDVYIVKSPAKTCGRLEFNNDCALDEIFAPPIASEPAVHVAAKSEALVITV